MPRPLEEIDWSLDRSRRRLAAYLDEDDLRSATIERGVIDRLLDERSAAVKAGAR